MQKPKEELMLINIIEGFLKNRTAAGYLVLQLF
jgi:hypothetical protein